MSVAAIKPYFSSKLKAQGYEEWTDGFGDDNIPSTIIDRSFHQRFVSAEGVTTSQETFEMRVSQTVKVFFKGFNSPAIAIDEAIVASQGLIVSILQIADYKTAGISGLFFDSFTVEPFDAIENDNLIVAELNFSVIVYNCLS